MFKAQHFASKEIVALKRLIFPHDQHTDSQQKQKSIEEGVCSLHFVLLIDFSLKIPMIALREMKILKALQHPNVICMKEISIQREHAKAKAKLFVVFPFMQHDLAGLLENPKVEFTGAIIKCFMKQLLEGIAYLHRVRPFIFLTFSRRIESSTETSNVRFIFRDCFWIRVSIRSTVSIVQRVIF